MREIKILDLGQRFLECVLGTPRDPSDFFRGSLKLKLLAVDEGKEKEKGGIREEEGWGKGEGGERDVGGEDMIFSSYSLTFVYGPPTPTPVAQMVKTLPAMQETWVQSLG